MLVGARLQCPLVVGIGEGEMFLASSIAAFLRETRRVQLIEDGEVVAITQDGARSSRSRTARASARSSRVDWDDEAAEKHGYETFMLKEIYEQPQAVARDDRRTCRGRDARLEDIGLDRARDAEPQAHGRARHGHRLPRRRGRPGT